VSPDEELILIFGALHLVALGFGALLFLMFLRSESQATWRPTDEDEGGGGGNDRLPERPRPRPTGGVPLPVLRGNQTRADVRPRERAPR
jgi:hypothetical protein